MVGRGADLHSAVGRFLADETTQRLLHRQEAGLMMMMTSDLSASGLMIPHIPVPVSILYKYTLYLWTRDIGLKTMYG